MTGRHHKCNFPPVACSCCNSAPPCVRDVVHHYPCVKPIYAYLVPGKVGALCSDTGQGQHNSNVDCHLRDDAHILLLVTGAATPAPWGASGLPN